MKTKKFFKDITFESNTIYQVEDEVLNYYKKDTKSVSNIEFFCSTTRYSDALDVAIHIDNKENIVLDFNNSTLFLNGALTPIIISNCKNIEIKNVVVKYDRSFNTQMTLIEKGEDFIKVKVDERFPYEINDGKFIPKSKYWRDETLHQTYIFLQEFDPVTRIGLSWPVVMIGNKDADKCELPWGGQTCSLLAYQEGEYVIFKGKNIPDYHVGSILILCMNNRDISNLVMYNSSNIKISNYRIVNGLGMGLLPIYCKDITIDGLKMFYDDKSIGIISNTADGIHGVALKGDFILKNSIITGTIDDALNIHSNYYVFEDVKDNVLTAICAGPSDAFKIFDVGDKIAIYLDHTMEKIDEATILNIKQEGKKYYFTLDKNIIRVNKGSLIENLSTQPNIYITNCEFGKANTHLRFQSRGEIIIDNCITEMDILFTGDTNFWYESSPVTNVTIKNTKFIMDKSGVVSIPEFKSSKNEPYYHKNITVTNCEFSSPNALYIRYSDNINFYDCTNKENKPFEAHFDNAGTLNTNLNVNIKRTANKGDRDE
ncbi:MAG: hypothetical protein MR270_07390 [Erysipelotrichaceae bacterium]|nr:hypothetical protein [Erysipelotrichaceae bacterium]